jgi:hypothetical protein
VSRGGIGGNVPDGMIHEVAERRDLDARSPYVTFLTALASSHTVLPAFTARFSTIDGEFLISKLSHVGMEFVGKFAPLSTGTSAAS